MPPRLDLRLIVITDKLLAAPRAIEDVVRAALVAGAPAIQLRDKEATARELLQQAQRLRELTREHRALLFINDRLDVALAAGADGVHLGPDDIPLSAARAAVPAPFLIGVSTDDVEEARRAQQAGADYIGCGAVFATSSKVEAAGEGIGVDQLQRVCSAVTIPVLAIGGIQAANAAAAHAAGAAGVAVISAVMTAADTAAAVRSLLDPFRVQGYPGT